MINQEVVRTARIAKDVIEAAADAELKELRRRELAYRGHAGTPEFRSVGQWYDAFSQTSDAEATRLLARAASDRETPRMAAP